LPKLFIKFYYTSKEVVQIRLWRMLHTDGAARGLLYLLEELQPELLKDLVVVVGTVQTVDLKRVNNA